MRAHSRDHKNSKNLVSSIRPIATLVCSIFLLSSQSLKSQNIKDEKTIAITQIVAHASLEEAKAGIISQLKSEGFESGKNLKIIQENAQGNIATANLIAKKFVGMKGIDLIIPISTPSALAVKGAAKGTTIPIVFSSVSDPVGAGLVKDLANADAQITGAVDSPAIPEVQSLMITLFPKVKKIGVLYNSGESNSVKTLAALKATLHPSFTLVERSVPNSNMVPDAVRALVGKVDAIYIPLDNTVFSALPKLVQIAREHKIPTFTNDPDSVKNGILACYGYSQFAVGQTAGELAAKVLRGEKNLKIQSPKKADVLVNVSYSSHLGLKIPKTFQKIRITEVN